MMCLFSRMTPAALALAVLLAAPAAVQAGPVFDPAGDLRTFNAADPASYAGPANPALDILSANVLFDSAAGTLTFTSTSNGPISSLVGPTNNNLGTFIWGLNHGYANNNFNQLGLPNVVFDAVLTINPNGTATYRGSTAPAGSVTISGNTITGVFATTFLAPPPQPANATGPLLPIASWTYNLWPRSTIRSDGSALGFGDAQIADFAPDNTTFAAQPVPEPSSIEILSAGLAAAGVVVLARRIRRPVAA